MKFAKLLLCLSVLFSVGGTVQAADKYAIDKTHSEIEFSVRHMMLAKVKGNFTDFTGEIMFDESNPVNSSVMVSIKTASVDTDNEGRDKHLRSPDFFDVETHAEITFQSTRVEKKGDKYWAYGNLNMHGVEKMVVITFEVFGPIPGQRGKMMGAEGHLTINRKDFNMLWNRTLDMGVAVSDEVEIELMVEARQVMEE